MLGKDIAERKLSASAGRIFRLPSSFVHEIESLRTVNENQLIREVFEDFIGSLHGGKFKVPIVVIDLNILKPVTKIKPIDDRVVVESKDDWRSSAIHDIDTHGERPERVTVTIVTSQKEKLEQEQEQEQENEQKRTSDLALAILAGEDRLIPIEIAAKITGHSIESLFRIHNRIKGFGEYLGGLVLFTLQELESYFETDYKLKLEKLTLLRDTGLEGELTNSIVQLEKRFHEADLAKKFLQRYSVEYLGLSGAMEALNLSKSRTKKLANSGRIGTSVAGRFVFTRQELAEFEPNPTGLHLKKEET